MWCCSIVYFSAQVDVPAEGTYFSLPPGGEEELCCFKHVTLFRRFGVFEEKEQCKSEPNQKIKMQQ